MTGRLTVWETRTVPPSRPTGDLRRIVVVRHAKAEAGSGSDFDRRLTDGGRHDAEALGGWLAAYGVSPDHVLVSAAVRARETWVAIAEGGRWNLDAQEDRGLYAADPDTALDLVRTVHDGARTLVVVGHNPTVASLAQLLDDGEGDPDASNELLASGYPTSAATVLAYDGPWADLTQGAARVEAFHVGRA